MGDIHRAAHIKPFSMFGIIRCPESDHLSRENAERELSQFDCQKAGGDGDATPVGVT